jgi:hypothetical protein
VNICEKIPIENPPKSFLESAKFLTERKSCHLANNYQNKIEANIKEIIKFFSL